MKGHSIIARHVSVRGKLKKKKGENYFLLLNIAIHMKDFFV